MTLEVEYRTKGLATPVMQLTDPTPTIQLDDCMIGEYSVALNAAGNNSSIRDQSYSSSRPRWL